MTALDARAEAARPGSMRYLPPPSECEVAFRVLIVDEGKCGEHAHHAQHTYTKMFVLCIMPRCAVGGRFSTWSANGIKHATGENAS